VQGIEETSASSLYGALASEMRESVGLERRETALNDLNVYDFVTGEWQRIAVLGVSPCPRGYCRLKINPADGTLWMMGGRASHHVGVALKRDIWCFNFSTERWKRMGKLPLDADEAETLRETIVGDVIFKHKWYCVFVYNEGLGEVAYLDLKTHKWTAMRTVGERFHSSHLHFTP